MNEQELREWLQRHGATADRPYRDRIPGVKVKIRNPDPNGEEKEISVDAVKIVANDGSEIMLRPLVADHANDPRTQNRYEVIGDPKITTPASGASTRETVSAPATQEWLVRDGPNGIETIKNPNYKGPETEKPKVITSKHDDKTGVTNVLVEKPSGERAWETITGGPTSIAEGKWEEVNRQTEKNEQTGQSRVVITEKNSATGETRTREATESVTKAPEKPTYKEVDGRLYEVKQDGTLVPARIEGDKPGSSSAVNLSDLKFEAGKITSEGQQVLQRIKDRMASDPNYTWKDGEREWNQFEALKGTRLAEIRDVLSTQGTIFRDESANYREQLQDQSSRRTFAGNTMGQALRTVESVNSTLKPGSDKGGRGLLALLQLGYEYAEKLGGTQPIAPPTMGAGLQEAKGITINIGGGGGAAPVSMGAPAGASPIGDPAVEAAAALGMGGDFATAPGMSFSGGQIRAPGYQDALDASGADYMQNVRGVDDVAQTAALETAAQLTEDPFFGDEVVSAYRSKYRV